MNWGSNALIVVGLFLVGGVVSFAKQGLPRGVVVLLGICAAMFIVAGISMML